MAKVNVEKRGKYYSINGISGEDADSAGKALVYSRKIGKMFKSQGGSGRGTMIHKFFLADVYLMCLETATVQPEDWMDAAAITKFKKLKKELEKIPEIFDIKEKLNTKNKDPKIDYKKHLSELVFNPLPHQEKFLNRYIAVKTRSSIRGNLLNAAAGTGKTYTSVALGKIIGVKNTLVISPNQAIESVWGEAFGSGKDALFKRPQKFWTSKRPENRTKGVNNFICHYEYLGKMFDRIKKDRLSIDYIIVDESHNFANSESAQSKKLIEIINLVKADDVLLLSGTPIKAMAKEVASVFYMVDKSFDSEAYEIFKSIHGGRNNGAAVEILRKRLGMVSFIIEKKALKLKAPIYTDHHLVLDDIETFSLDAVTIAIRNYIDQRKPQLLKQSIEFRDEFYKLIDWMFKNQISGERKSTLEYKEYLRDVGLIIDTTNYKPLYEEMRVCARFEKALISQRPSTDEAKRLKEIKGIIKYPVMVAVGEALGRVMTRRRIDCYKSMAREINFEEIIDSSEKKTVIFTSFVEVADAVYERTSMNYHPLKVYGDMSKNLATTVKTFRDNKKANPLVATYASLSTAVPLVMADTMILIDLPYREFTLNQSISRIHRIGNTTGTYVHKFTIGDGYPENIVSRGFDIISWAKGQAEEITGVKSPLTMLDQPKATEESVVDSFIGLANSQECAVDSLYKHDLNTITDFEESMEFESVTAEKKIGYFNF